MEKLVLEYEYEIVVPLILNKGTTILYIGREGGRERERWPSE